MWRSFVTYVFSHVFYLSRSCLSSLPHRVQAHFILLIGTRTLSCRLWPLITDSSIFYQQLISAMNNSFRPRHPRKGLSPIHPIAHGCVCIYIHVTTYARYNVTIEDKINHVCRAARSYTCLLRIRFLRVPNLPQGSHLHPALSSYGTMGQ